MFKKFLSLFLVATMIISTTTSVFAFSNEKSNKINYYEEIVNIDGESIEYRCYDIGNSSYIEFEENSENYIIERNNETGIISMNGEYVTNVQENSTPPLGSSIGFYSTWVWYDSHYSSITASVITVATWASIVGSLLGISPGSNIVISIATQFASQYMPIAYYCKDMYYLNPVVTPRPDTGNIYTFYRNANYTGYITSCDLR